MSGRCKKQWLLESQPLAGYNFLLASSVDVLITQEWRAVYPSVPVLSDTVLPGNRILRRSTASGRRIQRMFRNFSCVV